MTTASIVMERSVCLAVVVQMTTSTARSLTRCVVTEEELTSVVVTVMPTATHLDQSVTPPSTLAMLLQGRF